MTKAGSSSETLPFGIQQGSISQNALVFIFINFITPFHMQP
jgi:hypothetical protein